MARDYTQAELEAFLDEELTPAEMSEIEQQMRSDVELGARLRTIHGRRDAGIHSLGEIWRRHRIGCPDRDELGSLLLGILDDDHAEYIRFHVEELGCRYCSANLDDMKSKEQDKNEQASSRRRKYFQSSAGYLRS